LDLFGLVLNLLQVICFQIRKEIKKELRGEKG
jgi:hypothetical protein